jgi:exopolysaccharide biosynthesis polyprenyl glycosylphosphotransferase
MMTKVTGYKYYLKTFTDFTVITFCLLFSAYYVKNSTPGLLEISSPIAGTFVILSLLLLPFLCLIILYNLRTSEQHTGSTAGVLYLFPAVVFTLLVHLQQELSSSALLYSTIPLIARVAGIKSFIKYKRKRYKRNVIIVGDGQAGRSIADYSSRNGQDYINFIGFINHQQDETNEPGNNNFIGTLSNLRQIAEEHRVDEIIISIDNIDYDKLLDILDICNSLKVKVRLSSPHFAIVPKKLKTVVVAGVPLVDASDRKYNSITKKLKRIVDVLGALLGLILLSPVFIFLAATIKLTSKGPVFYKQVRIGKDGKPFDFYKFRSMTVSDGEDEERKKLMLQFMKEKGENGTKIVNDTRVTWIGKFIRKTSIDELPQLFNVIKGDMSLVGPRPCLPYEYENYEEWQKRRTAVIPGCTGLWQVSGRSQVSFNDSVILDLYYIKNVSLWFDVKLIFKTIPVMFFSKGGL